MAEANKVTLEYTTIADALGAGTKVALGLTVLAYTYMAYFPILRGLANFVEAEPMPTRLPAAMRSTTRPWDASSSSIP
ncbi:hypothetical protein Pyn_24750 [Prunus yedoensis var. nudiflora]|uniref:Uncharacterized protein n=1 Tax=Prunus yedoensis var. nudiflora TaxID=2094558 RepID=A0A314ZHK0_PRUYE|nr:hypothetical protein Pyn_24750 [Prunus yedoensis var. nudiflora]